MRLKIYIILAFCSVSVMLLSCINDRALQLEKVDASNVEINELVKSDSAISSFITPYKERVDSEMDSILTYNKKDISKKDSKFNTAIGNLMADAVFELANPVFKSRTSYPFNAVLLNYGGIRAPISKGVVTTRTAYQIMPFENEVVVVELSGVQMKELFAYLSSGKAHPISGLELVINEDNEVVKSLIQGQEVVDDETYFIATSDYLQKGGDQMTFLTKPISILKLDYKIRNLMIDYFKKYDTIAPVRDNRFIKK